MMFVWDVIICKEVRSKKAKVKNIIKIAISIVVPNLIA
jgi:hypothetical protein